VPHLGYHISLNCRRLRACEGLQPLAFALRCGMALKTAYFQFNTSMQLLKENGFHRNV